MKRRLAAAVMMLTVALVGGRAQATVVRNVSLQDLAHTAQVIVHAVVHQVDDDQATDFDGPFLTEIEFEIIEGIKTGDKVIVSADTR